ncbi:MAG: hypothetical protein HY020_21235 [Burkholderiales bacterium]|nr:hypothetical protein [Burkholderiales bacterium]
MATPSKPTGRVWIDTEFNGFGGELISMALVDADDHSVYFALPCPTPVDWVAANVVPVLGIEPTTRRAAQASVRMFLHRFSEVCIVANWPDDIRHFCAFMVDGPAELLELPPVTFELRLDYGAIASATPHNALADALALRELEQSVIRA